MKLTELTCPACQGTLKIDETNPCRAVCEYCRTEYVIQWKDHVPYLNGQGDALGVDGTKGEAPISGPGAAETGAGQSGSKVCLFLGLAACLAVIWITAFLPRLHSRTEGENSSPNGGAVAAALNTPLCPTGVLGDFCETVFGMPAADIPKDSLGTIRWLEIRTSADTYRIGYSFEDPFLNPQAQLTYVTVPRDNPMDFECLPVFTGLVKLSSYASLEPENLTGLRLKSIAGYFNSLDEAASLTEHPDALLELEISADDFSLQGLERLPALSSLSIRSSSLADEKLLVQAASLKSLALDVDSIDTNVLSMLPRLEELSIRSESLKDLGFVSAMTGLKSLEVSSGSFLTLSPLSSLTGLTSLSVTGCDQLKDMSAVGSLTGLSSLSLEIPYGCPEPDLSALIHLRSLFLDGFTHTGFLRNMPQLSQLTLSSCTVEDPADIAGLSNLKSLTCTSFAPTARDYSFICGLTALENLDMDGIVTYGDISGFFNLPALKRLNISNMECEIDFDKITGSASLEELSMDKIKLYKNVRVSGGGGIIYVDWDDVKLKDHLDFFGKLSGLKYLSIRENELTDLGFAAQLSALETLDITDNYVADLTALAGLQNLKTVRCTDNPISNYEVLRDSVSIIR